METLTQSRPHMRRYKVTLAAKVLLHNGRRYKQTYRPVGVWATNEDEALERALEKLIPPTAEDFDVKYQDVQAVPYT